MTRLKEEIAAFIDGVKDLQGKLPHSTFNYCSVRSGGRDILIQGRLFFNTVEPEEPFTHFASESVKAGQFRFSELGLSASEFINAISDGVVPIHDLIFPPAEFGSYGITTQAIHPAGLAQRNRLAVLTLTGADRRVLFDEQLIDWELRAAERPYDTLSELLREYRLGFIQDGITVEVVVPNVVQVDLSCAVEGTSAQLGVLLPHGLDRESVSLGYRVIDSSMRVVERARFLGQQLTWGEAGTWQQGRVAISVPRASVVHCVASYEGKAQNFGFIADPHNGQNDRRSAYEIFDPEMKTLKEFLFRTAAKGVQARDMEAAASWLFWLLGFNVATLGLFPKTQEAPDLVVTSRRGDYLAVECTLGMLRAENKLATVVRRAAQIKDALTASGNSHLRVLPMMITSLSNAEISAEIEPAERAGVVVIAREHLEGFIAQTIISGDPDRMYEEAVTAVSNALAKFS